MEGDLVSQVRRFNRAVTQRIGALSEEYLARSRPLGASRVLREIGVGGADVRAIRSRLDLDSGYLSRLLRGLEDERLVRVRPDRDDHRVRVVRLTGAGRAERAELDRRSDELARSLLAPLNDRQRARLAEAMGTVERLLTALKFHGTGPAELKRMWVAASARGLGVGRRILTELECHASQRGVTVVRLETNQRLTEAISLYRSAGYAEVAAFNDEPYAHHWFEKRLTGR